MGKRQPGAPLRVLMVTGAYFPEISSGGLQCQEVARMLTDRITVQILTTAVDAALPRRAFVDGVPVTRVAVDVTSPSSKLRAAWRMFVELIRLGSGVDIVHLHGCSQKNVLVTVVAKLLGKSVVLSLHTAGFDEPDAIARQGRLAWWAFTAADAYLSVSPHLVDAYLAADLPAEKVRLVPSGIDLERFYPASTEERMELRRSLGIPVERPAILFVGFFSREKQPHVLFDAWLGLQRNPALASTLLFVGATRSKYFEVDESLEADMRDRAGHEGVADRLVFVAPTHRVQDYYRAADLFALPSSREGLPVALLEAMATGLPAVASRLPGATDVLIEDGQNGVLVPPGNVDALADALRRMLTDRSRAAALGVAARSRVTREFGSGQTAGRWLEAYRRLHPTLQ